MNSVAPSVARPEQGGLSSVGMGNHASRRGSSAPRPRPVGRDVQPGGAWASPRGPVGSCGCTMLSDSQARCQAA